MLPLKPVSQDTLVPETHTLRTWPRNFAVLKHGDEAEEAHSYHAILQNDGLEILKKKKKKKSTRHKVAKDIKSLKWTLENWVMTNDSVNCSLREIHVSFSDSVSSKETGNVKQAEKLQSEIYISFPNPETSISSTSDEEAATNGKTPLNSEQEENDNSREESCHKNSAQKFIRRLSPEGAEHSEVNTQMALDDENSEGYLTVPNKRFVCEAQQRETLGSSLGCTPSGRMDDKMYWALEGDSGGTFFKSALVLILPSSLEL